MVRLTGVAADARPASQSGTTQGTGTPGDDVLYITEDGSPLYGLGGDDQLLSHRPGTEPPDESRTLEFYGGDGNDLISGFGGIRIVADGGSGNDDIDVRAESVDVFAGAGNDRVKVGSDGAVVYGGDGNDLLDVVSFPEDPGFVDGGAGNDTILAGARLSGGGQRVVARGGSGDDTISVHPPSSTGSPYHGIDANGGAGRDVLTGSDDAEFGADLLYGGTGNDRLSGRRGDDKLGGDGGVDTLTGGAGEDVFDFNQGGTGVGAGRRDVVADFAPGQDTLDLLSVDANAGRAGDQAFAFVGARAFTGAGQVRLARADGDTVVQGSTDRDAAPEFEILLANGATPAAGDFLL